MSKSSTSDFANYSGTRDRIELPPILFGLIGTIAVWIVRRRQREALAELDEHLLNDVGLSPDQARREAAKPPSRQAVLETQTFGEFNAITPVLQFMRFSKARQRNDAFAGAFGKN